MLLALPVGLVLRLLLATAVIAAVLTVVLDNRIEAGGTSSAGDSVSGRPSDAGQAAAYRVTGTGRSGLTVRSCPSVRCSAVGALREGARFVAVCRQPGDMVSGNRMWLRGTVDGPSRYAAARYLWPEGTRRAPACDSAATTVRSG